LTGKYRLFRDSQTISIPQGDQKITVEYFTELVVGNIIAQKLAPEKLEGDAITVMRGPKAEGSLDYFSGRTVGRQNFHYA
jgi:hypothetical protein